MDSQTETPTDSNTPTYSTEDLITAKEASTKDAYKNLDHISPYILPGQLSLTIFLKIVLPVVITVLAIQRFSPLIIGLLGISFWAFQLIGPEKFTERLMNGYQINPETAHDDEKLLYDLFIEICEELNCNPDEYNLIIHDSKGAASADPNNKNLFITHDTIEKLSKTEIKSVLAHELTHTTHAPTLTRLYTLTSIPIPVIAAPLALLPTTPFELVIILLLLAFLKKIASLTLSRQMELESDDAIPQHYHHHYAHALTQISQSTPHIQSKLGRLVYAFIDSHPPLNERITTTINITLPKPDDYKNPDSSDHIGNLIILIIPILLSIGLFAYFTPKNYALSSGIAVFTLSILLIIGTLLNTKDDSTPERAISAAIIIPTLTYIIGSFFTPFALIPPTTELTTTLVYITHAIGFFVNKVIISFAVGYLILISIGIPINFFSESEEIPMNSIYDDTHQEDSFREHYQEGDSDE